MALKIIIKIIICFFVFSCSSSSSFFERLEMIKNINSMSDEKPIKIFSRQELENINYPLIEIKTNGILKQSLMLPLSQRNNYFNYSSGSGQLITINGFVVTKTNGINIDLLSVEVPKESPLLNRMDPRFWLHLHLRLLFVVCHSTYYSWTNLLSYRITSQMISLHLFILQFHLVQIQK